MTKGAHAVFLDRDGTLNEDTGYVWRKEDFKFLPGVKEALGKLQGAGYLLVVATNQSGIARGLYSEEDYRALEDWMEAELEEAGIRLAGSYHCPHHPDFTGPCPCRKPGTGMFRQAAEDLGIEFDGSWAVGDNPRDLSICGKTPCRGVLLGNSGRRAGGVWLEAPGMLEAANLILKESV